MRARLRTLIVAVLVAVLVLAFAAGVPAGTLEAAIATPCPAAAQADGCCGEGGGADPACAAQCAAFCNPSLAAGAPTALAHADAGAVIAFSARARGSWAHAPDAAPPKALLP